MFTITAFACPLAAQRDQDMFTRSTSVALVVKVRYVQLHQYMFPDITSPILMNARWKSYQGEL